MITTWIRNFFLSPHLWLGAAALSVVGSFVIDYIDAQKTADRALALRQGPPPVASLQAFDPAVHLGPAREVLVRAETVLSDAVVVELGPPENRQSAVIYPLFPLSDRGAKSVTARLGSDGTLATIRPMPRPEGPVEVPQALGVILHISDGSAADSDTSALIARHYGRGAFGSVVEVSGERIAPGDLALVVKGAMAARDMTIADGFLAISPYVNGRIEALSPPPSSGLQRGLFWGGLALGLGAMLLSLRTIDLGTPRTPAPKRPGQQDTRVSTGMTPKARSRFQTIPTQDELYAAAQVQEARAANDTRARKPRHSGSEKLRMKR